MDIDTNTDLGDTSADTTTTSEKGSLKAVVTTGVVLGAAVAVGALIVFGCAKVSVAGWRKTSAALKTRAANKATANDAEPMAQAA